MENTIGGLRMISVKDFGKDMFPRQEKLEDF